MELEIPEFRRAFRDSVERIDGGPIISPQMVNELLDLPASSRAGTVPMRRDPVEVFWAKWSGAPSIASSRFADRQQVTLSYNLPVSTDDRRQR